MAHDPRREDYQRLSLRFAEELDKGDPADAARAFASFGRRFAQDRDGLPQTDADRAFHLVATSLTGASPSPPTSRRPTSSSAGRSCSRRP